MRSGLASVSLAVLVVLPLRSATAQPPVSFSGAQDFMVDDTPLSVATGKFDADDNVDIVAANSGSDDVSVLLGDGAGSFTDTGMTFAVDTNPTSVAVGDFNNDGKLDIITANDSDVAGTVSVLLNDGNAMFGEHIDSDTGTSPQSVVVGFFDDDEFLDAATADNGDQTVTILKGAGDGSFTVSDVVLVGTYPVGLATADLNGDGLLDLVVTNDVGGDGEGSITVLKGLGGGQFEAQDEIPIDCGSDDCEPVGVAIADFNKDSKLDLAVVNSAADNVSILLGNGNLTFRVGVTVAANAFPEGIVTADFNGDGNADIATSGSFDDNVVVLVGVGNGTFLEQPSSTVAQDAATGATTIVLADASHFPGAGTVQAGIQVLEYLSKAGNTLTLSAPLSQAVTAQTPVELMFSVGATPFGIASGDFNNDQKPDLVTANEDDDSASVLLNTSAGVSSCVGDCHDTGEVTIDDIVTMVNIAVGSLPITDCPAGDANHDDQITVDDILKALNNALNSCPLGGSAN